MNARQIFGQVRKRLRDRLWPGSANTVFGSVHVSQNPSAEDALIDMKLPMCFLSHNDEVPDPELVGYSRMDAQARLVVAVAGDIIGEAAVMGANRASQVLSEGAGILEVEAQLKDVIKELLNKDGIRIALRRGTADRGTFVEDIGYAIVRTYRMLVDVTNDAYYHPPQRFHAADAMGGDATLTWADPPTRFDSRGLIIRRAAGATAPATSTAGTAVATPALGVLTFTDSPGVGQFSYAIFMAYTNSGQASDESFSDQETGTTSTVTVT